MFERNTFLFSPEGAPAAPAAPTPPVSADPAAPTPTAPAPAPAAPTPTAPTPTAPTPTAPASAAPAPIVAPPDALGTAPPAPDPNAAPADPNAAPDPSTPQAVDPASYTIPPSLLSEHVTADAWRNDPIASAYFTKAGELGLDDKTTGALLESVGPQFVDAISQPIRAWNELQTKWSNELKADPVIGGDKLDGAMDIIRRVVIPEFFTVPGATAEQKAAQVAEVMADFKITGGNNNPRILRGIFAMAQRLTEGGHVVGSPAGQGGAGKTSAELMFPNHNTHRGQPAT